MTQVEAIRLAIERAGGPSKVTALLRRGGQTPTVQAVCFWRDGLRAFPPEYGAALEAASGVSRKEMFPNDWAFIWPEIAEQKEGVL